jgi:pyruvate,water dikinase
MGVNAATLDDGALWVVDNHPSTRFPIYTRANIGEVFPDVVMPFSWTIWGIPLAEPGWKQAFINLGAFDGQEFTSGMEMLSVFGGYGYLNVSASRIFGARTPGLSAEAVDRSFFGEQPDVPPYVAQPTDLSPKHSAQLGEMLGFVFTATELPELLEARATIAALRDSRPDYTAMSNANLLGHVRHLCRTHWGPLWVRHIMATYHSTIPPGVIGGVCAAIGRPDLATTIMAGLGGVDSAAPALALWELSRTVRQSPTLMALFDGGLVDLQSRLAASSEADAVAFSAAFAQFLRDFGFRGPQEWEMRSRCWEVDPLTPLAAIDRQRLAPDSESPQARTRAGASARAAAIAEVEALLAGQPEVLLQFQAVVRAASVFLAGRERTKTNCAMLTHEMRMAMFALGARMVAAGVFTAADQFALLTDAEWDKALADPAPIPALIAQRTAQFERLSALEAPFIVNGAVPPLDQWKRRAAVTGKLGVGAVLTGVPGCSGVVQGRVCIIEHPSDPKDLEPGDILVAASTDPSWTPLFSAAGGVVVNVGATVSHAVIVARELGVPCAVSVTGATDLLPHGATVEVDGGKGTVTVLALP